MPLSPSPRQHILLIAALGTAALLAMTGLHLARDAAAANTTAILAHLTPVWRADIALHDANGPDAHQAAAAGVRDAIAAFAAATGEPTAALDAALEVETASFQAHASPDQHGLDALLSRLDAGTEAALRHAAPETFPLLLAQTALPEGTKRRLAIAASALMRERVAGIEARRAATAALDQAIESAAHLAAARDTPGPQPFAILAAGLIALGLSAAAALRGIIRPLERLAAALHDLAAGAPSVVIPETRGVGVIAALEASLQALRTRLATPAPTPPVTPLAWRARPAKMPALAESHISSEG